MLNDESRTRQRVTVDPRRRKPPSCELELLTPKKAAWMLEHSASNRRISPKRVADMMRDIIAGDWEPSSDMAVDWDGNLQDGQHTATACVKTGCSIEVWIKRGMDPDKCRRIDTGRARTHGNLLHRDGFSDSKGLAAALKWLGKTLGGPTAVKGVHSARTQAELDKLCEEYPLLHESLKIFMSEDAKTVMRGSDRVGAYAALHCILMGPFPKEADFFFKRVVDGAGLDPSVRAMKTILRCRTVLSGPRDKDKHTTWGPLLVGILSWNAYIKNRAVEKNSLALAISAKDVKAFPSHIIGYPEWSM